MGVQHSGRQSDRMLDVQQRQQQGQRHVGEDAVHRSEQQQAFGRLPRGTQVVGHQQYHGRRGRRPHRGGRRSEQRLKFEPAKRGIDRRKTENALGDRRDCQPAILLKPDKVEAKPEFEHDQAERQVDHHACGVERIQGKQARDLRSQQHAGEHVTRDAGQREVPAGKLAAQHSREQQHPEQYGLFENQRPLGQKFHVGPQASARAADRNASSRGVQSSTASSPGR